MLNILIIETEFEGHYLTGYIKYILRSFKNQKVRITLVTSAEAKLKANGQLRILRKEKVKFNLETIIVNINNKNCSTLVLFFNQVKLYFIIKKKFKLLHRLNRFDYVFLTSLQKIDKALAIFGSPFGKIKFTGIFLELKFHLRKYGIPYNSRFNFLSKFFFIMLIKIKTLNNIIVNDHLFKDYIKLNNINNSKKIKFLHDPKEFNYNFHRTVARSKLNLPKNAILILVYGALIESKGINELLSIYKFKKLNKNIKIILAGKLLGNMENFFLKNLFITKLLKEKKIFIFNEWISEEKEANIFSASDIVWLGYKNYSSPSGVFYQSIQKTLPMIISDDGLINNLNNIIKVGYAVNIFNYKNIIKAIYYIMKQKNKKKFIDDIIKFSKISNSKNWVSQFKNMHQNLYVK